eukprot:scaffold7349_cov145-Skeletonema_menzelii.AAC.3
MIWNCKRIVAEDQYQKKIPPQDLCVRRKDDILHTLDVWMTTVGVAVAPAISMWSGRHHSFVMLKIDA